MHGPATGSAKSSHAVRSRPHALRGVREVFRGIPRRAHGDWLPAPATAIRKGGCGCHDARLCSGQPSYRAGAARRQTAGTAARGRNPPALRECRHRDCRNHSHRFSAGILPVGRYPSTRCCGLVPLRAGRRRGEVHARTPLLAYFAERRREPPMESGVRRRHRDGGSGLGCGRHRLPPGSPTD